LIREQLKEPPKSEQLDEPIFARLPSERELLSDLSADEVPLIIDLPGNIRIEIGAGCSVELMTSLIHTLNAYA